MYSTTTHVIHEKSKNVPIKQDTQDTTTNQTEYGLKQNFFDPSKSSPPNKFIIKLRQRISLYQR